jgi:hypothetical protein
MLRLRAQRNAHARRVGSTNPTTAALQSPQTPDGASDCRLEHRDERALSEEATLEGLRGASGA